MKIAFSPGRNRPEVLDIIYDIFSGNVDCIPAETLLEVDLDNSNQTLHPLPVLLNYGDIEKIPASLRDRLSLQKKTMMFDRLGHANHLTSCDKQHRIKPF